MDTNVVSELRKAKPNPKVKAWSIAATARVHGLAVCTRDERGFRKTGVSVLNPF